MPGAVAPFAPPLHATAPRDIETSNRSTDFHDAMIMIVLCIEMSQGVCGEQKIGWAEPTNALRRNGIECAAVFDNIQSMKSGVTNGLIQVGNLSKKGPLATVGAH